jgi:hypothetical protein
LFIFQHFTGTGEMDTNFGLQPQEKAMSCGGDLLTNEDSIK